MFPGVCAIPVRTVGGIKGVGVRVGVAVLVACVEVGTRVLVRVGVRVGVGVAVTNIIVAGCVTATDVLVLKNVGDTINVHEALGGGIVEVSIRLGVLGISLVAGNVQIAKGVGEIKEKVQVGLAGISIQVGVNFQYGVGEIRGVSWLQSQSAYPQPQIVA